MKTVYGCCIVIMEFAKCKWLAFNNHGIGSCGIIGHYTKVAAENMIRWVYKCRRMKRDICEFMQNYLHCIILWLGEKIRRLLAFALQGKGQIKSRSWTFCSWETQKCLTLNKLLGLKDDLKSYIWLHLSTGQDNNIATRGVSKWIASFSLKDMLVSDRGAHYTAAEKEQLTDESTIQYHFSPLCCPRTSRTAERLWRKVLNKENTLLSVRRLSPTHWLPIVGCMQAVINPWLLHFWENKTLPMAFCSLRRWKHSQT